jgi:hypothetical protein
MVDDKLRTMHEVMKMLTQAAVALKTAEVPPPEELIQGIRETAKDIRDLAIKVRDAKPAKHDSDASMKSVLKDMERFRIDANPVGEEVLGESETSTKGYHDGGPGSGS